MGVYGLVNRPVIWNPIDAGSTLLGSPRIIGFRKVASAKTNSLVSVGLNTCTRLALYTLEVWLAFCVVGYGNPPGMLHQILMGFWSCSIWWFQEKNNLVLVLML